MSKLLALLAMVVMALAFLLGAAAYFLPRSTDWNAYKPDIVSAFAKHTGLQLQIQGDVEFVFLPRPRLTMKQGVIKNTPPRAVTLSFKKTSENILEVPQLDAYLDLIPLLTGKLNVDVRLVNPQLNIERFEDQLYNVSPFIQAIQKQHKGTGSTIGGEPDGGIGSLTLKGVEIANGQIQFNDLVNNTQKQWQITNGLATLDLGYGSVKANGTVLYDEDEFDYSLVASPDDKTKTRFITQGMIAQRTQTGAHSRILHYNGFLWSDGNPRVVVRTDAREKFVPLSGKETNSVPSSFWTKAEVEAVWGETPTVRITELAFGFGESEEDSAPVLEGSAELLWQRENATLVLTSEIQGGAWSTQEVQGLLAYAKHLATDKNTPTSQNQEATGPPNTETNQLLKGLDASVKFSLEALSYGGIPARHIRANLRNQGDQLLVQSLSLRLAGDSTLTTSGIFSPNRLAGTASGDKNAPEPFYSGSTSLESGDLPQLLDDLQNRSGTPRQAATSPAKAQGTVRLFREAGGALSAQLRDLQLSAAGSKATADLDWRGGTLAADVKAQRLDVNRILETFGSSRQEPSPRQQANPEGANALSLALLLSADRVLYNRHRFDDLVLRADRKSAQQWRIERLATGYSGWQISASGILASRGGSQPYGWTLTDGLVSARVQEDQLRRAAAVVGLSARRANALRGASVKSSLSGGLDRLALKGKATFSYGLEVSASGSVAFAGNTAGGATSGVAMPQLNLRGEINAPDIRPVADPWLDGKEVHFLRGVLTSDLAFTGGLKNGTAEIVSARIGTFPFKGEVSWQEAGQEAVQETGQEAVQETGQEAVQEAVAGQGNSRTWQARLRGGRLDMNRRATDSTDPEGGLAPAVAKVPFARRVQNLSRRPFGFRFNEDLSLALDLELDSLILGKEKFSKPRGRIIFEDGKFVLQESFFAWQNAVISADGTLRPDPASATRSLIDFNLAVEELALEPLLQKHFDFTRVRGTISATGEFNADATSAYALAQSLAGTWQTTGTVRYIPEEEEKIASLVSLLLQNKLQKLPRLKTYSDALNFSFASFADRDAALSASGQLDRLAFQVRQGEIQNNRARLTFAGTAANFSDNSLDLQAEIFEEQQTEPAYKITLLGPIHKPKVQLEATGTTAEPGSDEYENSPTLRIPDESIDQVADEVIKSVLDEILDGILNP